MEAMLWNNDKCARRFLPRLRPVGDCLEWSGPTNHKGYGLMNFGGRSFLTHRFSWELAHKRPVPDGLMVMHKCDNPCCCAPAHLVVGTHLDNMRDMKTRGRSLVGEKSPAAKLREHDIPWIRAMAKNHTYYELGAIFGVTSVSIGHVVRGVTWGHVPAGHPG